MTEPAICTKQTYRESYNPPMPAEYCDEEAEPGFDHCLRHLDSDEQMLWQEPEDDE